MLSDSRRERLKNRAKRRAVANKGKWYSDAQKLEAVQLWLVVGSLPQVAAALSIDPNTLAKWRYSDWWKELVDQIKAEGKVKLSNRLQKIAGKSLDELEERLEKGDWILDSKTGSLIRKPLLARDLTRISSEFIDRVQKIESVTKEEATVQAVEDRLKQLADAFASFSGKVRRIEVEDIECTETASIGHSDNESHEEDISLSEDPQDTSSPGSTGTEMEESGTLLPSDQNPAGEPTITNSGSRVVLDA